MSNNKTETPAAAAGVSSNEKTKKMAATQNFSFDGQEFTRGEIYPFTISTAAEFKKSGYLVLPKDNPVETVNVTTVTTNEPPVIGDENALFAGDSLDAAGNTDAAFDI